MNPMTSIEELLRDTAPDHDHLVAHTERLRTDVLIRATARPHRRVRRPLRAALAAAVVATVGVGGVAYATGTVPPMVSSAVRDFGQQTGIAAKDRPEMQQVIDLELPDGSRFAAWSGVSDAMWCTAYADRWDGTTTPGSGAAACSDDAASFDLNRNQIAWAQDQAGTTYYPVLFGEPGHGVAQVRIRGVFSGTGERVDLTVPVDPATSAYAVVLPGTNPAPWGYLADDEAPIRDSEVSLDLLDDAGRVLQTLDGPPA